MYKRKIDYLHRKKSVYVKQERETQSMESRNKITNKMKENMTGFFKYTFFTKTTFCKNSEAQIVKKIKNNLRTTPG